MLDKKIYSLNILNFAKSGKGAGDEISCLPKAYVDVSRAHLLILSKGLYSVIGQLDNLTMPCNICAKI